MMRIFLLLVSFLVIVGCTSRETAQSVKPKRTLDSLEMSQYYQALGGQFYDEDIRNDSALYWYTRATEFNRDNKHAWHGVALALGRLGRHNESGPAYDEALRIDSNYVLAIWHRACGHAITLDKQEALADLRRAILLDSTVKQGAQEDRCFEWMWEDRDFLAVVK